MKRSGSRGLATGAALCLCHKLRPNMSRSCCLVRDGAAEHAMPDDEEHAAGGVRGDAAEHAMPEDEEGAAGGAAEHGVADPDFDADFEVEEPAVEARPKSIWAREMMPQLRSPPHRETSADNDTNAMETPLIPIKPMPRPLACKKKSEPISPNAVGGASPTVLKARPVPMKPMPRMKYMPTKPLPRKKCRTR